MISLTEKQQKWKKWYSENRVRVIAKQVERQRQLFATDPKFRERRREYQKRHRIRHAERLRIEGRERARKKRAADPEKAAALVRQWYWRMKKNNPEKLRAQRKAVELRSELRRPGHKAARRACWGASDRGRMLRRRYDRMVIDSITDHYAAKTLNVRKGDLPQAILELQRLRIKVRRELNK